VKARHPRQRLRDISAGPPTACQRALVWSRGTTANQAVQAASTPGVPRAQWIPRCPGRPPAGAAAFGRWRTAHGEPL